MNFDIEEMNPNLEKMSPYFDKLEKIEFVVTYACTGKCKHCSEGDHKSCGESIDPENAAKAVHKVAENYPIRTVMAFGGEPLLYPEAVYAIMRAAKEENVPKRQVITNGYFSKDSARIEEVAEMLSACGVNDLLLSVDAFHQEAIPLDTVREFAIAAHRRGIPIRLSPAWLVGPTDDNPYNRRTREILGSFADMSIEVGDGNVIFPEGNARKYLAEYFCESTPENPYTQDPCEIKCLSIEPDGALFAENIYRKDALDIIKEYSPH